MGMAEAVVNRDQEIAFIVHTRADWKSQAEDYIWNLQKQGNKILYIHGAAIPESIDTVGHGTRSGTENLRKDTVVVPSSVVQPMF